MFSTDQFVKAKIRNVIVLSQKNRKPEEAPGAKFTIEMQIGNSMLEHFDSRLKGMLFTKDKTAAQKAQGELDGVEAVSDLPNLTNIAAKLGWFKWGQPLVSYVVEIDYGMGGKSNLKIPDATLFGWEMQCKEGGSVLIRSAVESADVSKAMFGELAKLKATNVQLKFIPPTEAQMKLVEEKREKEAAAEEAKAKPGAKTATEQFLDRHAEVADATIARASAAAKRPIAKAKPAPAAKKALRKRR